MESPGTAERLDSWKEIASYFGRDVRTVQRWEKLGLPVRRKLLDKLSSVYAFRHELEHWWNDGRAIADETPKAVGSAARRRLLAILPLRNQTGNPDQEYFTDGLTEELIGQLSRLSPGQLGVIAGASAMMLKHTAKNVNQIGRELGASYLLDGNVRRSGDRVRIAINLIDADDQGIIWSETYDRSLSDILELQSDVARAVTTRIAVTIAPQERERLSHASTVPPQAYENYLKGRALWNRRREDDLRTAPRLFEEAIAQDLNYAPAYAGLADCYAVLSNVATSAVAPTEVMPRARAAACRALKLDPNLADAHASLAYGALFFEWDWQAAGVHFKRALELNPSYGTARHVNQLTSIARHKYVSPFHFATAYAGLNDHDRAFQWLRRANAERCEYLVYLHQEPAADPIRSDPRFRKIVPPPPSPNRQ